MACRPSQAPHPDLLRLAPTAQGRLHGGLESTQRPSSCLKRKAVRSRRIPGGTVIYGRLGPDLTDGNVVVSNHWCAGEFAIGRVGSLRVDRYGWHGVKSSVQNTDLDYQLQQRGVENLIIGGLNSNTCMESNSRYAYELWVNPQGFWCVALRYWDGG